MRRSIAGRIDWILLFAAVFLMLFSMVVVYSASAAFAQWRFGSSEALLWNHALRVLLAVALVFGVSRIDYHWIVQYSRFVFIAAVVALGIVLVVANPVKGAVRWLTIGPVRFQPSELAKFALVFYLSFLLVKKQSYRADYRRALLPLLMWIVIVGGLVALQPNVSTAALLIVIGLYMLWIGNIPWHQLVGVAVVLAVVGVGYAISAPYRVERLQAYWEALQTGTYSTYQVQQALLAFSNGGVFGVGPGHSVQRDLFLPEAYGDFVFAIIGEEYGFIGCSAVIAAFVVLLWRGLRIAQKAPDNTGYFLATGLTFTIVLYAVIHMGVNVGIIPTTGLPLPFVSYGGTSLLLHAFACGVLLNISAHCPPAQRHEAL